MRSRECKGDYPLYRAFAVSPLYTASPFDEPGLEKIVAFTTAPERDFDHPNVPDGRLERHAFYAVTRM